MRKAALQHIAFNCRDIRRQEAFYTKHFGFRRVRVFERGKPDEFLMLRLGPVCIELFPNAEAPAAACAGGQPVGFQHLAFEVPDLDKAMAGLHADGIATEPVIDCSGIVPGMRICFLHDPDGNRIELMQGYQDERNGV